MLIDYLSLYYIIIYYIILSLFIICPLTALSGFIAAESMNLIAVSMLDYIDFIF